MNMRKLLLILFIIPFQLYCQERLSVNSTKCMDTTNNRNTFEIKKTGNWVELEDGSKKYVQGDVIQKFCVYRQKSNGEPITGIIYDKYSNGDLKYEIEYKNGKVLNKWFIYYNHLDGEFNHKIKHRQNIFGTVTKSVSSSNIK